MAKRIFGSLDLQTQSSLILRDLDNSHAISVRAPAVVAADLTLTLPAAVIADGVLSTNGSGVISSALLLNANIDAAAAIALSKLAALTGDRVLLSSAGGEISASAVTNTTLGFLDATSSIQTQLNGKAGTLLDNLAVSGLASQSLLVGSSSSAVASLAVGSDGQVLKVVAGNIAWAADAGASSFAATWETADGVTKTVTHSLGTKDVIVQLYDIATDQTIEVDIVDRTTTNAVELTASEAPGAGSWRVLVIAV